MKKKEYIRDNGKIRNCPANIVKMNIFTYISWDFKVFCYTLKQQLKQTFVDFFNGLIILILTTLFPITIVVRAVFNIRRAKKEIKRLEENKNEEKEKKE
jgi:hypothetical protein